MNFKNDMAASGKEAFGMEVCDKVAFGREKKEEKTSSLLTTSAALPESALPEASMSAQVRPPFQKALTRCPDLTSPHD